MSQRDRDGAPDSASGPGESHVCIDPLFRHRSRDPLFSIFSTTTPRVESMFDVSAQYRYQ